ncbi:hypothetical protein IWW38_003966 [Coemansia aciculifera]|uniref:Uncharacterized protein n=1 Tax=Coemansia aciculifera TaxID=417176 RepID=A0ACC1M0V1_9FUNG|nr:hypothetical protein IWW38_003966 [Coemansia aciculifera]
MEGSMPAALVDLTESLLGGGEAEAERRWEQEDAEMREAAHVETVEDGAPLPPLQPVLGGSMERGRARVSAGNQLLSRIVSRSVITSISRELERRRRRPQLAPGVEAENGYAENGNVEDYDDREEDEEEADEEEADEEEADDRAAFAPSAYVMDFTGRLNLYYHVSVFILSVLEASIDDSIAAASSSRNATAATGSRVDTGATSSSSSQDPYAQEREQMGGSSLPEAMVMDADDGAQELQFRMFLLPGAIDQALAEYASTHTSGAEPATPDAPLMQRLSFGTREHNTAVGGDQRRLLWQREREEKLQRLRDIARAMRDERGGIQIPVAVLGLRINSELRRSTRAAMGNLGERRESAAAAAPPAPATAAGALSHSLGLHDALRGLRNRLSGIVPGFLAGHAHPARQVPPTASPADSDIQPEQVPALSDVAAEGGTATAAAAAAGDDQQQPGLSVYITIHYMPLGNPLMLPMAAYALFPELVAEDSNNRAAAASAAENNGGSGVSSGNNYDLFMEIANIIGQASSTTVSQDVIDKRLRKYVYYKGGERRCPVARLLTNEDGDDGDEALKEIPLVSADRCPVCLDDFETGDVLRVLECHHGLHMTCGDAWFTKGSNKCPICRSEAVHSDKTAT